MPAGTSCSPPARCSVSSDLTWLRDRLDEQGRQLGEIRVSTAKIEGNLAAGSARMDALEARQTHVETKLDTALLPGRAAKWVAAVAVGVGALVGLAQMLGLTFKGP